MCMLIKSKNDLCNLNLYIHDEKVDYVNSFEHVGIHIDHNLSMNNHVDSIFKKCTVKLSTLYKIRGFISSDISLSIYTAMIRPDMDYGDFVIDSAYSQKLINWNDFRNESFC